MITLRRTPMLLAASLLSLMATACDEGSPNPDDVADDATSDDATSDDAMGDGDGDGDGNTSETNGNDDAPPLGDMPSEEPVSEPCDAIGSGRECPDAAGTQFCDTIGGEQIWGACLTTVECTPGDSAACFPGDERFGNLMQDCLLTNGVPHWDYEACNTPLVLSFSVDAPIEMEASSAAFDIAGAGECLTTDWPAAANPWLAIDLDKNGAIDGGHELFGSGTVLGSGRHASNGFIALASLDSTGDGKISAADVRFDELLVWRDEDGDKLSLPHELGSLTEAGVHVIELGYVVSEQCDTRGNCGRERSSFGFIGATGQRETGEVVDVHLACQ